MDAKKIKYNHELIKTQVKLENQLLMIDEELKKAKNQCYHVTAIIGEHEGYKYKQCLLCGYRVVKNNPHDYTINTLSFKEEKYGNGENAETRTKRYDDLHEIVISILNENPDLDEYGLLVKLNEELESKQKVKVK